MVTYAVRDLDQFKAKLLRAECQPWPSLLGSINYSSTEVKNFRLVDSGRCEVVYASKHDTFKLNLHFADASYALNIGRDNPFFQSACESNKQEHQDDKWNTRIDQRIVRKNVPLVGIAVGDILKCLYHTSKSELPLRDKHSRKTTRIRSESKDDDKAEILSLATKALCVDTLSTEVALTCAYIPFHDMGAGRLCLWSLDRSGKLLPAGPRGDTFEQFCKRLVYVEGRDFFVLNPYALLGQQNDPPQLSDAAIERFFNKQLPEARWGSQLLRYFLHGEDPNANFLKTQRLTFEKPTSVGDVLQLLYEESQHDYYFNMKRRICRKLNNRQQQLLTTRYAPSVVQSLRKVAPGVPLFALRNVHVKEWVDDGPYTTGCGRHFHSGSDTSCLWSHSYAESLMKSSRQYKFKSVKDGSKAYTMDDLQRGTDRTYCWERRYATRRSNRKKAELRRFVSKELQMVEVAENDEPERDDE